MGTALRTYFMMTLICQLIWISSNQAAELAVSSEDPPKNQHGNSDNKSCPKFLKDWVTEDFKDQTSWGLSYPSEAKTCQSALKNYQTILSQKNKNPISNHNLGQFYQDRWKQKIHPGLQYAVKQCQDLDSNQYLALQTRFYSASSKIEAVNSSLLQESFSLMSVLPSADVSASEFECSNLLPDLKAKCTKLNSELAKCRSSKNDRLQQLVEKTQMKLPLIENLTQAYQNCLHHFYQQPGSRQGRGFTEKALQNIQISCDPIASAIEIQKNEIPWIRGEKFQNIAVLEKSRPRNGVFQTKYDLSQQKIQQAIQGQLQDHLKILKVKYQQNLDDMRCLTQNPDSRCDIKSIRSRLIQLPDLRGKIFTESDEREKTAKLAFQGEECLLERNQDRSETQKIVNNSMQGIALTLATFGVGEIVQGIRISAAISPLTRVQQSVLLANVGMNGAIVGRQLTSAYQDCFDKTNSIIQLSHLAQSEPEEGLCQGNLSSLAQAKQLESECLTSALLAAPSVLPFAATIPSLKYLTQKNISKNVSSFSTNSNDLAVTQAPSKTSTSVVNLPSKDMAKESALSSEVKLQSKHDLETKSSDIAKEVSVNQVSHRLQEELDSFLQNGVGKSLKSIQIKSDALISAPQRQRLNEVMQDIRHSVLTSNSDRVQTISGIFRSKKIVPDHGVIHIVGSGGSAEEWVLPLMSRSDTQIHLFEPLPLNRVIKDVLNKEDSLKKLWSDLNRQYPEVIKKSHIQSFERFQSEIQQRIRLHDGYQLKAKSDLPVIDKTLSSSKGMKLQDPPNADLILFNFPHLDDAQGLPLSRVYAGGGGQEASGVKGMIESHLRPGKGLVWVNSEDIHLRMGKDIQDLPGVQLPASLTTFDSQHGLKLPSKQAFGYPASMGIESFLYFP
jgi:hypothetical protein